MPTRSHSQRGSPSCAGLAGSWSLRRCPATCSLAQVPPPCFSEKRHTVQPPILLLFSCCEEVSEEEQSLKGNVVVNCINRVDPGTHVQVKDVQVAFLSNAYLGDD